MNFSFTAYVTDIDNDDIIELAESIIKDILFERQIFNDTLSPKDSWIEKMVITLVQNLDKMIEFPYEFQFNFDEGEDFEDLFWETIKTRLKKAITTYLNSVSIYFERDEDTDYNEYGIKSFQEYVDNLKKDDYVVLYSDDFYVYYIDFSISPINIEM